MASDDSYTMMMFSTPRSDVPAHLREALDNDVREVPLDEGFLDRGQLAVRAFRLHGVVIYYFFVDFHSCGSE